MSSTGQSKCECYCPTLFITKFRATGKMSWDIPSAYGDKEIMVRTDTSHVVLISGFRCHLWWRWSEVCNSVTCNLRSLLTGTGGIVLETFFVRPGHRVGIKLPLQTWTTSSAATSAFSLSKLMFCSRKAARCGRVFLHCNTFSAVLSFVMPNNWADLAFQQDGGGLKKRN